ncbi:MAG: hypothetical protein ACLPWF_18255 [Bryobacteraceae bacterium]
MQNQVFVSRVAVLCAFLGSALAQTPLINSRSVFNAASYMPAGIPASAIAQGSVFTIFGSNIGPTTAATANSFPLGTTLAGVGLNVIQGSTTVSAIPVYVSASQINAIMPSNAPIGAASLQVLYNNARSNMAPVQIASTAFGIYTALGAGMGPGILQNYVSPANQPINAPKISAQPGQTITLWGTGLGPITSPDNQAPPAGSLPVQVQLFVGGVPAQVTYSGRSPCCSGTDQIVFTVPNNAPQGCWVPVYVKTAGSVVSNFVSMAIQTAGGTCGDPANPQISSAFVSGGNVGGAIVARVNTYEDVGVLSPVTVTGDYHLSSAYSLPGATFPFNPGITLPPPGTCTVYAAPGDLLNGTPLPGSLPPGTTLDLGPPLVLTGPNGLRTLNNTFTGPVRAGFLGGFISNNILPNSLYLSPGSYSLMGLGGMDVGAFSTSFTIPQPFSWTNQTQTVTVNRTQPLTVSLSGVASGSTIYIAGVGEDLPTNSSAMFLCNVPAAATSFTVPSDVLSNLPATRGNPLQSKDVIYVIAAQGGSLQNWKATGINQGATAAFLVAGKTVVLE